MIRREVIDLSALCSRVPCICHLLRVAGPQDRCCAISGISELALAASSDTDHLTGAVHSACLQSAFRRDSHVDSISIIVVVPIPHAPSRALVEQGVAVAFTTPFRTVSVFCTAGGLVAVTAFLVVGQICLVANDNLQLSEVALDVVDVSMVLFSGFLILKL